MGLPKDEVRSTCVDLPLRCRCGHVRGVARDLSRSTGNRVICYCDDCQAFARFLERTDVMDSAGGTDVFQMAPARIQVTEGTDALRCLRLSDKGLYRWYTDCCRTPIGNMVGSRIPAIGVIHSFMDHEADGRNRDDVLGKPIALVHGRFAVGGIPPHAHATAPLGVVGRVVGMTLGWWIAGLGSPNAFFDPSTKAPRVKPRVLTTDERAALRSASVGS